MQEAQINARITAALAKAASVVGRQYEVYRPTSSSSPVGGVPYTTLYCAFDTRPDLKLISTTQPNRNFVTLLADPSSIKKSDYLVGDDVYFVARIEPLKPALCVLCDHVIDVLTASLVTSAGSNAYGGLSSTGNAVVAAGWPVCMTARTRGEADVTKLPSDVRAAYYDVLIAEIPGVQLTFGMQIQDANGQNYEIISADLSLFGWKLLVGLITT